MLLASELVWQFIQSYLEAALLIGLNPKCSQTVCQFCSSVSSGDCLPALSALCCCFSCRCITMHDKYTASPYQCCRKQSICVLILTILNITLPGLSNTLVMVPTQAYVCSRDILLWHRGPKKVVSGRHIIAQSSLIEIIMSTVQLNRNLNLSVCFC